MKEPLMETDGNKSKSSLEVPNLLIKKKINLQTKNKNIMNFQEFLNPKTVWFNFVKILMENLSQTTMLLNDQLLNRLL